jgi:hypothetical protein
VLERNATLHRASKRAITRRMTALKIREELASVVLLGNFNPAIFQPAWLAAKGLIRESEATGASVEVIHPELSQFRAAWLHLQVTRDRFVASTSDPAHWAPLRDLCVGTFELLEQTPTSLLGLNRVIQVELSTVAELNTLGHLLAPSGPWSGVIDKPGMLSLMMSTEQPDRAKGRLIVRVEPSAKFPHTVFFEITKEFAAETLPPASASTATFIARLRNDWDAAMNEAGLAVERLMGQVPLRSGT